MSANTYTKSGTKATSSVTLDKDIFGLEVKNHQLLKDVYVAYLSNGRVNLAVSKTRGEVSGGGKKPWKQKGTGRARFGSSRVPIWRGGGITFGPTGLENYTKKVNVASKRTATRQALSLSNAEGKLSVIEDFEVKDGKTKSTVTLLNKIGADRSVLLVVADKNDAIVKATRNISYLKVVQASYLNVYDIMNSYNVIITKPALSMISEWLGDSKKADTAKGDK